MEISSKNEAQTAIKQADGIELKGRVIRVNEARPKTENRRGGGGRRGGFDSSRGRERRY